MVEGAGDGGEVGMGTVPFLLPILDTQELLTRISQVLTQGWSFSGDES